MVVKINDTALRTLAPCIFPYLREMVTANKLLPKSRIPKYLYLSHLCRFLHPAVMQYVAVRRELGAIFLPFVIAAHAANSKLAAAMLAPMQPVLHAADRFLFVVRRDPAVPLLPFEIAVHAPISRFVAVMLAPIQFALHAADHFLSVVWRDPVLPFLPFEIFGHTVHAAELPCTSAAFLFPRANTSANRCTFRICAASRSA